VRIAVVNQHLRDVVGGSELQCHLVATGLVARGHDVTYLALDGAPSAPEDATLPYRLVPVEDRPRAIVAAVRAAGADVVYWRRNRHGLPAVLRGLGRAGIPLVFAVAHVDDVSDVPTADVAPVGAGLRTRLAWRRRRFAHRRASRAFRQVAGVAAQRVDQLGRLPVALERHVPNAMDPTSTPFSWPRPYVAWVGNLKPRKRPELIPLLAATLEPAGIDLLVAGPVQAGTYPWLREEDGRLVTDIPNLVMLGAIAPREVTGLVAGARCLAFTGMPEGFSNVMIQSWWGGTPTVSLDYDPDGLIAALGLGAIAGGDVPTLLEEVRRHAADEELSREVGARAQRYAHAAHDPDRAVELLEQLLSDVLARRATPGT